MVRANRGPANGGNDGSSVPFISEPDPDYVQCEHCNRRFNETAAERHIPICAASKHRSLLRHGSSSNLGSKNSLGGSPGHDESLKKRLQFKPPPPRQKSPSKR